MSNKMLTTSQILKTKEIEDNSHCKNILDIILYNSPGSAKNR